MKNKIFIISGQTGIGKNYILKKVLPNLTNFQKVITCVTREPRIGEVDGIDHYFITPDRAKEMLKRSEFAEHANVHGRLYGTPKKELDDILSSGKNAIMEIDVQGADQIKQKYPDTVMIFLKYQNGDLEELIRNHINNDRSRQFSEDEIRKRVASAWMETRYLANYDYSVINPERHPEKAVKEVVEIIKKELSD